MNLKIQSRNVDLSDPLEKLLQRRSRKARQMLPTFRSHDLDLHVTLEKLSRGKQYQTTLVLTLPQTAFRVEDIEENVKASLTRAFDELMRKIKRFKSQLNRERFWQRPTGRTAASPGPGRSLPHVEEAINNNLDKVENYIRRELFHKALSEHFPPGVVQPQALVDEVFLDVSARVNGKPDNLTFEQWMFQIARDKVRAKIVELEAVRDQPHIEETRGEEDRFDDEVLNFYQPDESLRLEDLLPDQHVDNPEEILASEEIEDQVQRIIAQLPRSVRESFVLYALEGFNSDEVAMITGRRPTEVLADVERARTRIKEEIVR